MEEKNESVAEAIEEETPEAELTPETDWEAEAKKARGIAQRLRTKLTKATEKKVEKVDPVEPVKEKPITGELDETQLDYLDLKGITADEDIELIQKVMGRTGQTVRQALKDEYVQDKLKANQANREVKAATPSSTKRAGGGQSNDLALALAKYEQSGMKPETLPEDFALRSAVINAMIEKANPNKPSWH